MNVKTARKAAEFVRCCDFDDKDRLKTAFVPGHEAKLYQVKFRRVEGRLVVSECVNPDVGEMCKGHRHNLCFHALAALIHAADKKGLRLTFCASEEKAERIKRTGGTVVQIVSGTSGKGGWIVYRPKKKSGGCKRGRTTPKREGDAAGPQTGS